MVISFLMSASRRKHQSFSFRPPCDDAFVGAALFATVLTIEFAHCVFPLEAKTSAVFKDETGRRFFPDQRISLGKQMTNYMARKARSDASCTTSSASVRLCFRFDSRVWTTRSAVYYRCGL